MRALRVNFSCKEFSEVAPTLVPTPPSIKERGSSAPLLYGRRRGAVALRRKLSVLLAATMMLAMTLASGVALADNGNHYGQIKNGGGCDVSC
jgi:hypothetical protein